MENNDIHVKKQKIARDESLYVGHLSIQTGHLVSEDNIPCEYNLRAVVSHHGSVDCGHYTCDIFKDNSVEHCNDSIISTLTEEEGIKNAQSGYLFFYEHTNLSKIK